MDRSKQKINKSKKPTLFKTTRMGDILAILATILTFILPIKFGMITATPELAFPLPNTLLTLFVFNWPSALFSILSAILLIGVMIFFPPTIDEGKTKNKLIALSWFLLFLSAILGIINATTVDFYILQLIHLGGIASFAIAIYKLIDQKPTIKIWLINAIISSTILVALMGLSQYISGFDATLEYVNQNELKTGIKVIGNMRSRLEETRIFSTFSICNSLAAHLILTIPFVIWGMCKYSSTIKAVISTVAGYALLMLIFANISPIILFSGIFIILSTISIVLTKLSDNNIKLIMPLIAIPATGLLLFILRFTNSRGALIAFALSLVFLIFISPLKRKLKIILAFILPLLIIPAVFSDILSRSLSSMTVRFDYYMAATKMFINHPFAGIGWGDFFHKYTQIKQFPGSEAPHTPHNFILSFASQSGIIGLCASLNVIISPFYYFFKTGKESISSKEESLTKKNKNWQNIVIITGWFAWCLHSLLDFNIQIPGTVATAITMLLLIKSASYKTSKTTSYRSIILWYSALIPLILFTLITSINRLYIANEYSKLHNLCFFKVEKENPTPPSFETIKKQLYKTSKLMPYSPFPWMYAGKSAQRYQEWTYSEHFLKEAIKRSPARASLYIHLARAQYFLNKNNASKANYKKAAELFPNAYKK